MTDASPKTDTSPLYPGYDVMAKRDTPSWNEITRRVVETRLEVDDTPKFFSVDEFRILKALCDRIIPQPANRVHKVPLAGLVDRMLEQMKSIGYRKEGMPPMRDAWRRGLRALDEEAKLRFGAPFPELAAGRQDTLLELVQKGETRSPAWDGVPAKSFFKERVLHDVCVSYYTHPTSWNEIGFGGPAAPRGYVRMQYNKRDPWEAKEAKGGVHHDQ
jgi:hypothetical protein